MSIYDIVAICLVIAVFWPVNEETLREFDRMMQNR